MSDVLTGYEIQKMAREDKASTEFLSLERHQVYQERKKLEREKADLT